MTPCNVGSCMAAHKKLNARAYLHIISCTTLLNLLEWFNGILLVLPTTTVHVWCHPHKWDTV